MPREGHIPFEELGVDFGSSMTPGSLQPYTREENDFRLRFRGFVKKEVFPVADRIDREDNVALSKEVNQKMVKEGWVKATYPKSIGGDGLGVVHRTILGEELTAASYSAAVTYGASACLYGGPVLKFGTPLQLEKFARPILQGQLGAICITEPTGGSDAVGGMRTRAVREGDGYTINGTKRFITNGSIADYLLLYTISNPEAKPHQGMSAFIVPAKTRGFRVVKDFELMGRRGRVNSVLEFKDMHLPRENLLGKEHGGFEILMEGLDGERVFAGSQYLGISRSAFEIGAKYAAERMQFKKPLRDFEGISFKIAEMYANIEAARLMLLRAARMIDGGQRATKETAAAKFLACDTAVRVCNEAFQTVGGIAYTKEYPLERYLRDIRIGQLSAGSSEIMRFLVQREMYREMGY
ncbi:MAG: acyl-CoA/acyl-ACP dehydrogenase [Euryarchaeota archaeon]|nr:acyl-CoA/acyl-ACP dehydrogenase [Euryarchaeota archaeon]